MNWQPCDGAMDFAAGVSSTMQLFFRRHGRYAALLMLALACWVQPSLRAQDAATPTTNAASGTPAEQLAARQLELTNAWQQVLRIVNQPVKAYVRSEGLQVSTYHPGWFHEGASIPDFNNVDVRKSQELIYAKDAYVTSDLNPGIVFMGRDLEFNANTKLFYADRSLPKHRLSEAQMIEINRLYRIIGRCRTEIARLQEPPETETVTTSAGGTEEAAAPAGLVGKIQQMPREKRALYGGIIIGALLVIVIAGRLLKRRSE